MKGWATGHHRFSWQIAFESATSLCHTKHEVDMDWSGCDLVECVPGKVSGRPIVKGTRVLADQIVEEAALGSSVDQIIENYPALTADTVQRLLTYANSHLLQSR